MNQVFATCLLSLALIACGDGGVRLDNGARPEDGTSGPVDAAGGGTAGSGSLAETPTGTPTGNLPDTTAASRLNAADVDAARFLMQSTYGPTSAAIADYRRHTGPEAWIDAQIALPISLTEPYTRANGTSSRDPERHEIWWSNALDGQDQLRQRVAYALSQLFVISDVDRALSNAQYGMTNYYDMLAQGAFGSYRDLLEQVTLHPAMGVYLSMVLNEKANPAENIRPDENFAREVLQLFSLGLYELDTAAKQIIGADGNPVPAYSQRTVEEFARVFTGWNYDGARRWADTNISGDQYTRPMMPNEAFHDTGAKTLLRGAVTPAGLSARADLEAALDNIAAHPNVGPLFSKHLIQQLVTSDPSRDYVSRVSDVFDNDGSGARGNIEAVVKAVLLDSEARQGQLGNPDFGKIREPAIRFAHFWRALDATPGPDAEGVHRTSGLALYRFEEIGGQAVLHSPSVFNFYLPDHPIVPGGTRLAPEMQIMTEANLASTHNTYHDQVYRFNNRADLSDDSSRVTIVDLEPLTAIAGDAGALLDWYNLIFYAGSMPDEVRGVLGNYIGTLGTDDASRFARVQDTLFMVLTSPSAHIQR